MKKSSANLTSIKLHSHARVVCFERMNPNISGGNDILKFVHNRSKVITISSKNLKKREIQMNCPYKYHIISHSRIYYSILEGWEEIEFLGNGLIIFATIIVGTNPGRV